MEMNERRITRRFYKRRPGFRKKGKTKKRMSERRDGSCEKLWERL